MYIIDKTKDNRAADKALIEHGLKSPHAEERAKAEAARYKINNESSKVKSMREALVKAHRNGDKEAIKDIHDFVRSREDYR